MNCIYRPNHLDVGRFLDVYLYLAEMKHLGMVVLEMQDTVFLLHDVAIGILTSLSRLASSSDVTFLTMIAVVALKVPPSNVFLFQSRLSIAKTFNATTAIIVKMSPFAYRGMLFECRFHVSSNLSSRWST